MLDFFSPGNPEPRDPDEVDGEAFDNYDSGYEPQNPPEEENDVEEIDDEEVDDEEVDDEETVDDDKSEGESDNEDDEESEDSEEEDEIVDWEPPEWLPEDKLPPEKFKNDKERADWYEQAYLGLTSDMSSEDFQQDLYQQYQDQLLEQEEHVNELKELRNMLTTGDPETVLKMYAPHILEQKGYPTLVEEENAKDNIWQTLKAEFGSNFEDKYDPDEVGKDPDSVSSRIFNRYQQLYNEWQQDTKQKLEQQQQSQLTEEQLQERIAEQYDSVFKEAGYEPEEYEEFVQEAFQKAPSLTLEDMHKVIHFEDYIEDAKREAREEMAREMKQARRKTKSKTQVQGRAPTGGYAGHNRFGSFGQNGPVMFNQ